MQKIILGFFILLAVSSCSKKDEVHFEAFSPEAFAYDIGDIWEVNATVNVRGFEKIKIDNEFAVSISYSIDLKNPDGDLTVNIFSDLKEVKDKEVNDAQLEAQFELDSSYANGIYLIIFNIKDINTGKSVSAHIEFELED
jgi:hypothetical protein